MEKTVIAIMLIVIVSKILGFARDIALSFFFGATGVTDAYLISTDIPTVFFSFVGMGIAASFIPVFTRIFEKEGEAEANRFTSNLVNLVLLVSTVIVLLLFLIPEPIVKVFASGFEGETLKIAVDFTRIAAVSIYFISLIFVFTSFLEVHKRFLPTVLNGLPLNVLLLWFIYLGAEMNMYWLAYGTVLAVGVQFLFFVPWIWKTGYRHRLTLSFRHPGIRNMIFMAVPVIIGVSADQLNILVDRTLASRISEGGISALTYAHRVVFFIQAIFVLAIVKVMFPKLSKLVVRKDMEQMKAITGKIITTIALIVIPSTVGLMVFSREVTELLFGRGAFEAEAVVMTTGALFFYSVGILGFGLREVLAKVFYSMEDSRTPMIHAVSAMVLNIVLNILLAPVMGINGLALATSISALFTAGLLYLSLVKKVGSLDTLAILKDLAKAAAAAGVMGLAARSVYTLAAGPAAGLSIPALTVGILTGIIVYAVLLYLLRLSDIDYYKARLTALAKR